MFRHRGGRGDRGLGIGLGGIGIGGSVVQPQWFQDQNWLAIYDPLVGFADTTGRSPWGPLVQTGGTVPIGGGLNGQPAYQFTNGGPYLLAAGADLSLRWYPPLHVFALIKDMGGNGAGAAWFGNPLNGNPRLCFQSASLARFTSNSSIDIAATVANYNWYDIYIHSRISKYSVNGAPYTACDTTIGCAFDGLVLGAGNAAGTLSSNCEIAWIGIAEGQLP